MEFLDELADLMQRHGAEFGIAWPTDCWGKQDGDPYLVIDVNGREVACINRRRIGPLDIELGKGRGCYGCR